MSLFRQSFRQLLKSPGFTAVALATLALGIGVNTAMFSLVNTLLFRAAPYPESERLLRMFRTTGSTQTGSHSLPDLKDLTARSESLDALAYFQWWAFSYAEPGEPAQRLAGVIASANLFTTLGVQPAIGRAFGPEEQQPGRDRVVVLSDRLWRSRFAADPGVVGRSMRIDAEDVTIIGVLPPSAEYPMFWGEIDLWRPVALTNDWRQDRATHWLNAMGRLKPGISPAQGQAELSSLAGALAREYPESNGGSGLLLVPLQRSATNATERNLSWFAFGLAGFVLLIACANLANLQLARTIERGREFALRAALGASRQRLIAPLLAESLLLSAAGGLLGILIGGWISDALGRMLSVGGGRTTLSLDGGVLGFAVLASLLTSVLFGTIPAWVAARTDLNAMLKQQSRGSTGDRSQQRFRQALIVAEVALALVLLSGAGFFIRGLDRYLNRHPGWRTDGLVSGTVTLPNNRYGTPEQRRAFHRELELRLQSLPGVEQIALGTSLPIAVDRTPDSIEDIHVEGRPFAAPGQAPVASYAVVTPSYFATLQIPVVAGRLFSPDLKPDGPRGVVINETMARQLWPNEDPIGRRFSTRSDEPAWEEVIGVVRDVGFAAYAGVPGTRMQFYRPLVQETWAYITMIVRAPAPETFRQPLRQAVAAIDADLAVDDLRTIQAAVDERQNNFYVINRVLGGFALLGLALAAVGLYGVIAGFVVLRLPEFGIRQALGATPRQVLSLVLGKGLRLALLGIAFGTVGSLTLLQILSLRVPGLPGDDTATLAFNVALLLAVAVLACWLPARRATRVDPMDALRAE